MGNKYEELSKQYGELLDKVKDAVCDRMKELGHIKFNSDWNLPFVNGDGEFHSVVVVELEYNEEDDVTARSLMRKEWSIQEEGTLDGCLEMLYYLEEGAYEVIK